MQLDIDTECGLPDEHPTVCELTEEEAKLYWSACETIFEGVMEVSKYKQLNGEIDMESSELSGSAEQVLEAMVLCDLIEELAVWRLAYLPSPVGDKERPDRREKIAETPEAVEADDG